MLNGIYSSGSALDTASLQHEIIANNLANVGTAGFRRTLLAVQERSRTNNLGLDRGSSNVRGNRVSRGVIDFSPGSIRSTGRSLDLAIQGSGFFTVQGPQSTQYTRNGFFQINQDRELSSGEGFPVLADGSPVKVPAGFDATTIEISEDGSVLAGETKLGQLDLVDFEDPSRLLQVGASNFAAPDDLGSTDAEGVIVQGSLEQANTQAVSEMIQMILGSRQFESAQRALRTIADSIEKFTNMDQ